MRIGDTFRECGEEAMELGKVVMLGDLIMPRMGKKIKLYDDHRRQWGPVSPVEGREHR